MHDIESATDVKILIDAFYKKVVTDPIIGFFFTEVIDISWEKHIPIMNSFWCSVLFGTNSFHGNPMIKHFELDTKATLEQKHFERWLELWGSTIDENFIGEKANEAKLRAKNIAAVMQHKIAQTHHEKS